MGTWMSLSEEAGATSAWRMRSLVATRGANHGRGKGGLHVLGYPPLRLIVPTNDEKATSIPTGACQARQPSAAAAARHELA